MSELQRATGVFLIVCISAPANVEQVTHIGTTTTIGNVSVFSPSSVRAPVFWFCVYMHVSKLSLSQGCHIMAPKLNTKISFRY